MFPSNDSTSKLNLKTISAVCLIFGYLFYLTLPFLATNPDEVRSWQRVDTNISTTNYSAENFDIVIDSTSAGIIRTSRTLINIVGNTTFDTPTDPPTKQDNNYFVVFIIPSHPNKTAIRQAIRKTWANVSAWPLLADQDEFKKRIKVMFITGVLHSYPPEFEEEVSKFGDIFVVNNLTEGYYSLGDKVLWGLNYSYQHFDFQYLVKTDDDVIVNLPKLLTDLSEIVPGLHYIGHCGNPKKWHYCSGAGYVLSQKLVGLMLNLPSRAYEVDRRIEDRFSGWLVWNVNNDTEYSVKPISRNKALSLKPYKCGPLKSWFYHGYKKKQYQFRVDIFRKFFMNDSTHRCHDDEGKI